MKKFLFFSILFSSFFMFTKNGYSQSNLEIQKKQIAVYNISSGIITGGIGAIINKKKGQKFLPVFLKGMLQGGLGGVFNYGAKKIAYKITKENNYAYAWASKITHSIGISIINNAASNRNFWESYHIYLGPHRIEFDKKSNYKPSIKIAPAALVGNIWIATLGKFSLKESLQTGTPVFYTNENISFKKGDNIYIGYAIANATVINKNARRNKYELFTHEFIHTLQYKDFSATNTFYLKAFHKVDLFKKLNKWIYFDLHIFPHSSVNQFFKTKSKEYYYHNWFEFEAEHFSTMKYVPR